jgi:hypothetical protein
MPADICGGNWNGGGWKGAGAETEADCAGDDMRFSISAREGVEETGVGAGCGVCCGGGRKLARSCDGVPVGGNCGGKLGGI